MAVRSAADATSGISPFCLFAHLAATRPSARGIPQADPAFGPLPVQAEISSLVGFVVVLTARFGAPTFFPNETLRHLS